jgi:conjugative transfer signal peptidase TraF
MRAIIYIGVTIALVVGMYGLRRIRINVTPSIPIGLYDIHLKVKGMTMTRGTLVIACPPLAAARLARARQYLTHGSCPGDVMPVGKYIAAVAGDTVAISPDGVVVNGQVLSESRPLAQDHRGRELRHIPYGTYVIAPHMVWLAGDTTISWDSKYFGVVNTQAIHGVLTPLWTRPRQLSASAFTHH